MRATLETTQTLAKVVAGAWLSKVCRVLLGVRCSLKGLSVSVLDPVFLFFLRKKT
jgi:hypothetical protein